MSFTERTESGVFLTLFCFLVNTQYFLHSLYKTTAWKQLEVIESLPHTPLSQYDPLAHSRQSQKNQDVAK